MNITLFGAENDVKESYRKAAAELGRLIGAGGHTLVWGGVDSGLMHEVTENVQANGGKILGIGADYIKEKLHKTAEIIMTGGMDERNRMMLDKGEAIVALPGGAGTVNEITYVLRLMKQGFQKPIATLNTEGFFDGLASQFRRMEQEGFLKKRVDEMICFASTPNDAIDYITNYGN